MDTASLSKLNVSQLKAKCKELKITGYSKLSKAALIEKLAALAHSSGDTPPLALATHEETIPSITAQAPTQPTSEIHANLREGQEDAPAVAQHTTQAAKKIPKKRHRENNGEGVPPKKSKKTLTHRVGAQDQAANVQSCSNDLPATSNPPTSIPSLQRAVFQVHLLPARLSQVTDASAALSSPAAAASPRPPLPNPGAHPSPASQTTPKPSFTPVFSVRPTSAKPPELALVKYTRIVIENNPESLKTKPIRSAQTSKPKAFKAPAIIKPSRTVNSRLSPYSPPQPPSCPPTSQSFDFPPPPSYTNISFPRIAMPPSMSRRRQAERMSVVFSGISDSTVLAVCTQVSRAWRYAVYLSATHALARDFPGARTSVVLSGIKEPRMTNTWDYLRARRQELDSRRRTFEQSWLGRFTKKYNCAPISAQMWKSPDDPRQILLALRFVLTRLVFALARRYEHGDAWVNEVVVGAEELVSEEIWKVTTRAWKGDKIESFYVLFDTGEVVGHAPPQSRNPGIIFGRRVARNRGHLEIFDEPKVDNLFVRADWTKYVESIKRGDGPSLQDAITSADQESYVAGVSSLWLRGPGGKDDLLKTIARRYVLACVEPNSVSGGYKPVVGMARELVSGRPVEQSPVPMRSQHIGLLVSEHHLVESVHLEHQQRRSNARLHPALALVLTAPGREYFVLRDTGVPIGTNDEGLEEVWQEIIGCDSWGCVSA